jgi:HPt (histidine-containing phosphotransfer) domain-containing protein
MSGTNAMTIQHQVRDLLKRYCTRLFDQIESLDRLLLQNRDDDAESSASIVEAENITHEMKGTAGSLGFSDITVAASALDDDLKLLAMRVRISQSQLHVTKMLFARLRQIASQATPQKSALYDADLSMPENRVSSTTPLRIVT